MCEAFQITAAERPGDVALRTIADGISITWGEYSARVKRLAGGLAALGVGPGDTVGFMLTNRPEFHLLDTAAMHLGATPFSIYNTSSPEQIAYLLEDAANRVMIVEAAFMDSVAQVLDGGAGQRRTSDRARRRDERLDHARGARGGRSRPTVSTSRRAGAQSRPTTSSR